jgi:hypothetical protein
LRSSSLLQAASKTLPKTSSRARRLNDFFILLN